MAPENGATATLALRWRHGGVRAPFGCDILSLACHRMSDMRIPDVPTPHLNARLPIEIFTLRERDHGDVNR